jgi:hypothetical protein
MAGSFALATQRHFEAVQMPKHIVMEQRMADLVLEYKNGAERNPVAAGTAAGYEQIPAFKPIEAHYVRLCITFLQLHPTSWAIGRYKQAEVASTKQPDQATE